MKGHSPAAERNAPALAEKLTSIIGEGAAILEVASGSGQHAAYFCKERLDWIWQPSEATKDGLQSIACYRNEMDPGHNLLAPIALDVLCPPTLARSFDYVFCANMIHIAPWECALGLFDLSLRSLKTSGSLLIYGPFRQALQPFAPSNARFDESLRARNSEWGIRVLEDVKLEMQNRGFTQHKEIQMPANNLLVEFKLQAS